MLARAGVGRGIPRAGLLLMFAANAPDMDIVSWFGGSLAYLEYHRWVTHSLVAAPVLSAVAVLLVWLFVRGRPFPWVRAVIAALIGVSSHLFMDWTNVYGIRLLLPFSPDWLRLDITPIIDPWIWAALLLAIVAPALAKLVSSEIGAKSGTGRGWAIFALLVVGGYEYARYLAHDRALAVLNARIYEGSVSTRVAAFPTFWSPLHWQGVVETDDAYRVFTLNLSEAFNPSAGRVLFKAQPNEAMVSASKTLAFQRFLAYSSFPLWRTMPVLDPDGGTEVDLMDIRFGDPERSGFVTAAVVDRSNRVVRSGFSIRRPAAR
jgi:inner membrane protein